MLKPLREFVAAQQKNRDQVKIREKEGMANQMQLVFAEVEFLEARIRLAQAERNQSQVIALLESLVTQRLEEKRITSVKIEVGTFLSAK